MVLYIILMWLLVEMNAPMILLVLDAACIALELMGDIREIRMLIHIATKDGDDFWQ